MKVKEKEAMTLKFIVGIDGGGTKTTMEIKNVQTGESRRKIFGAFNINSTGENCLENCYGNYSMSWFPYRIACVFV
jgi:hypothetical protein